MSREPVWRRYLRFGGPDPEADLDEELQYHLDQREDEYQRSGMSETEAQAAARARLGDLEAVRRACREIARGRKRQERRRKGVLDVGQDLRFAARMLRRNPAFSAIAALTIAVGIGATTTMFAVVQAVVLRPLPFAEPDRVVAVESFDRETGTGTWSNSFPQFLDYEAGNRSFSHMAAWREIQPTLRSDDGQPAARIRAIGITHPMFELLGVDARLGRTFGVDDETLGSPPTAVLGHAFWRSYFGGDEDVLGRTIDLDGQLFTVIGVLPSDFRGGSVPPASADIWLPYRNSPVAEGIDVRGLTNVSVVARVADGVTLEAAGADIERMMTVLGAEHSVHAETGARIVPVRNAVIGRAGNVMWLLFGAVGLVLLIAGTNVTNLLLGRTADRAREVAVRSALGASRRRIIRLIVLESLVLATVGGVVGVFLALGGVEIVRSINPGSIPRLESSTVSPLAIVFVSGLTILLAMAIGLAPALHATGPGHTQAIQGGGRSSAHGRTDLRRLLVVSQVAVATVLLVGAGLMLRSLSSALSVDPGFDPQDVLTARIIMPTPFVSTQWPEHVSFFRELVENLEGRPSVVSAAAAYQGPTDEGWFNAFSIVGQPEPAPGQFPSAIFRPVTPGYFETVGVRVLRGRPLLKTDDSQGLGAVVVNEAFVSAFLADRDPIGARLAYGDFWGAREPDYEVVGVVEDVLFYGPDQPARPATYFPHAQQPVREMSLFLRTTGDPRSVLPALREEVTRLDPTLPLDDVTTLEKLAGETLANRRFLMIVFVAFAVMALVLAATGLYGVLSFLVGRRSHEIGVRLALGARQGAVLGLVMKQSMSLVAAGLILGVVGAVALSRLLAGLLFGVQPSDPMTIAATIIGLVTAALVASAGPAIRALRLDPAQTLRAD